VVCYWETLSEVQLSLVDFFRGNWATALLHAQASCQLEVERVESSTRGLGVGTLFRQMAYAGDRAGAFGILEGNLALLPVIGHQNIRGSWWMLALVIEGLVALGEQSKAAPFYPLARELIGTGAVALWPVFRFTQTIAGIAAAAARQWEAAEEHFQIALQQAESLPNVFEQAEIRRFRAMMLNDRAAPGDRETARTLLKEALETYTQIGMPRHVEMTQALAKELAE
jgi:tetratricopeptide (TPR) repeat protein